MSLLNYYSHLLLTNKYSLLIKISFSFLLYVLLLITTNTLNIAECTLEHPSYKQRTVFISQFAPYMSAPNIGATPFTLTLQNKAIILKFLKNPEYISFYTNEGLGRWLDILNASEGPIIETLIESNTRSAIRVSQCVIPDHSQRAITMLANSYEEVNPSRLFNESKAKIQKILSERI